MAASLVFLDTAVDVMKNGVVQTEATAVGGNFVGKMGGPGVPSAQGARARTHSLACSFICFLYAQGAHAAAVVLACCLFVFIGVHRMSFFHGIYKT